MRHYKSQLRSLETQGIISTAGGVVFVCGTGTTKKAALTDINGNALANPLVLTNGSFDFYVADTLGNVDLFIQAPTGHMIVKKNVPPSGDATILYDHKTLNTTLVIPFNIADTAAATETNSGFSLTAGSVVQTVNTGLGIEVTTLESGKTIDFGTANAIAETGGTENLFASALSTTSALVVLSAVTTAYVAVAAHPTITYTISSGAVAAAGFLKIPMLLPASTL